MNTAELRQAFLKYFEQQGHTIVSSSSLVPGNDPTLLFTNAGMVQFKDVFLGREKPAYPRATSSQRCVRAGGKHNDLENVGFTARHHTFFEMLGNFSFGDYFKREAIQYAWAFVTKILGFPVEKLWVTVYVDDQEAEAIWLDEIGIDPKRFSKCDEKDNFWSMGDTGPCGPCSEIFYDHGDTIPGGPPGSADAEGDRYIEIWNLVFMQFNRDKSGKMTPLPKPSVDTGMGLERVAAILQGVHSNYDIDIFKALIKGIAKQLGVTDLQHASLKVVADHVRSVSFLIADGVLPSNEGRGYVLRRIMRRAIRHGHKLGATDAFFCKLPKILVQTMADAYPMLLEQQNTIERIIEQEEVQFNITLDQGLKLLEQSLNGLKSGDVLPGECVFQLYDTYGFPTDLTADITRERGITLDMVGYEASMAQQRAGSRKATQFELDANVSLDKYSVTQFLGYEASHASAKVLTILQNGIEVEQAVAGQYCDLVLSETPFYAESGGQVGDTGFLMTHGVKVTIKDTQKQGEHFVHQGEMLEGTLQVGMQLEAKIDQRRRQAIRLNHSATHLMHAALRQVLGTHVQQKGSVVDAERLRFDFSHFEPVSAAQLASIEQIVNHYIRLNSEITTEVMPIDAARAKGAMALFGEKYSDEVRVLTMGEGFSIELCGGTHATRTGDIGLFKIVSESSVASGVRRLEAVTGAVAINWVQDQTHQMRNLASQIKTTPAKLPQRVEQLQENIRALESQNTALQSAIGQLQGQALLNEVVDLSGIKVLVANLENANKKSLRESVDRFKNQLGSAVIVLATIEQDKVHLVAGVTKDLTARYHAGKLINQIAQQVGGQGGGRADMAQAGGTEPHNLDKALALAKELIRQAASSEKMHP